MLQNKYEIIKLVGSGSQTEVYLGTNTENDEKVAIKKLKTANVTEWKTFELFERNIKVLKNLNHKGIPYFVDSFCDDNNCYYLIEQFIDGNSLRQAIDAGKHFTIDELYKIIKNILNILNYLHTLNPPVIHRDIKPSNIIIDKENNLFIIDFGAVQKDLNNSQSDYTVVGTAGYTPTEQFMGKTDKRSDLYSLGATIIHLLTHKHPNDIEVKDMKIDYKKYVDITDNFKSFIDKLIEPDIEKRFDSSLTALEYFTKYVENNESIAENNLNIIEIKDTKPEIAKPKRKYGFVGLFFPPFIFIAIASDWNISKFIKELSTDPKLVAVVLFLFTVWFFIYRALFSKVNPVTKNVGNNKAQKKSNGQQSNESKYNNIFIDKKLNDCVVEELAKNKFKLNYKSVKTIKTLDLTNKEIEDLSGIERLSNLEELNISFNKIVTIKHFKQLKKLRKLNISNNLIKSINPIKELLFIEELDISNNQIEDISVLTNLSKLRIIIMNCNFIKSLTPVQFLTNIEILEAETNLIKTINPLQNLKKLKHLNVSKNGIKDISVISNLRKLKVFFIKENPVKDTSIVSELKYIEKTDI